MTKDDKIKELKNESNGSVRNHLLKMGKFKDVPLDKVNWSDKELEELSNTAKDIIKENDLQAELQIVVNYEVLKTRQECEKETEAIRLLFNTDKSILRICGELNMIPTDYPFLFEISERLEKSKQQKDDMIEKIDIFINLLQRRLDSLKRKEFGIIAQVELKRIIKELEQLKKEIQK